MLMWRKTLCSINKKYFVCNQCDLILQLPDDVAQENHPYSCICPRCRNTVYFYHTKQVLLSIVFALVSFIFMMSSDFLPFLGISTSGVSQNMQLLDYTQVLYQDSYGLISICVFIFMQFLPTIVLLTIIVADFGILLKKNFKFITFLLRFFAFCSNWSMVDVFMVGVLVSLIKITSMVDVYYGSGFWCFVIFAFFYVVAVSYFNLEDTWEFYKPIKDIKIQKIIPGKTALSQNITHCEYCGFILSMDHQRCPRCFSKIKNNLHISRTLCVSFVLAALAMYIPANIYPMMITSYLGSDLPSTIIDGVVVLWQMESYFVAIVIIVASVCIPIIKICLLLYLCLAVNYIKKVLSKRNLAFIYRIVEFIGKWSMVDVFVVAIMSTIVKMDNLMAIYPGDAIFPFAIVVILTMIAARLFDPRLLWINLRK